VKIPDGCSAIGPWAFLLNGLKEVVTPDGCMIEVCAFLQC
jgi:hypothetical protein